MPFTVQSDGTASATSDTPYGGAPPTTIPLQIRTVSTDGAVTPVTDTPVQMCGATPPTSGCTSAPFPDVPADNEFCGDITFLVSNKIAEGFTDGNFHPTTPISRGGMAAFLYRYDNPTTTAPDCTSKPFPDVSVTSQFCPEIHYVKTHSIAAGYTDGDFRPAASVTRQAMAAFLYRLANPTSTAPACTSAPFPDVPVTSPFCGDVQYIVSKNVTAGYTDGDYHPTDAVTRQEMAAFLHRLYTATH